METITNQQRKILEALAAFKAERGYLPSQRELARRVGLKSPNTVDYHLKKLEEKGVISCPPLKSRSIDFKHKSFAHPQAVKIPLLGNVPAGVPSLAVEEYEDFIEIDRSLSKGKTFALKVKGDSMINAGILNGDIVIVKVQQTAQNGDIVVARFQDEATVKYFRQKKGEVFLVPANEKYKAIPAQEAEIVGKVVGVIRRY